MRQLACRTASTPAFTKPVNEGDVKALAQQLTILFNKGLGALLQPCTGRSGPAANQGS